MPGLAGACGARQRGFTLIELLVVIAIAALLVAIVPSAFGKLREGSQYRDTLRSIIVELRQARQKAIAQGVPVVFRVDLAQRQFGTLGRTMRELPASLELKATVAAAAEFASTSQADITFLPDGGATGGTLELVRLSGSGVRVRVDWLFGRVTQEPREP
jgi:general secretion pathway protein H